jgi:hypothetical protein
MEEISGCLRRLLNENLHILYFFHMLVEGEQNEMCVACGMCHT